MAASWSTLQEWLAARRISPAQFRRLDVAGIAPLVTKYGNVKIVTEEASIAWEKAYGVRVVDALFNAAQNCDDEFGEAVE